MKVTERKVFDKLILAEAHTTGLEIIAIGYSSCHWLNLCISGYHACTPVCVKDHNEDPGRYRGTNPLLIPMFCGFERYDDDGGG